MKENTGVLSSLHSQIVSLTRGLKGQIIPIYLLYICNPRFEEFPV